MKRRYFSKKNNLAYIKYTSSFAFITIIMCIIFVKRNSSFVYLYDASQQHIIAIQYLRNYIHGLIRNISQGKWIFPTYDLSIGQGADILTSLTYYGFTNPLYWLSAFFPAEYSEECFMFLYFLQLYLSGCSTLFLLHKYNILYKRYNWCAAVIYTFQAFSLSYAMRHPFFLTGMIYLPLMIAYARDVFNGHQKGKYLAFWSAICIYSNFYFGYINIILTSLYICIYAVTSKNSKNKIKNVIIVFLWILCGIFMASPLLVPLIKAYMNTYRSYVHKNLNYLYEIETYISYLENSVLISTSHSHNNTFLGVSGVCVASFCMLFSKSDKDSRTVKYTILIMLFMLMFPVCGSILNGFSYASNRWCYGLILMLSIGIAMVDLENITKKHICGTVAFGCFSCMVIWMFYGRWSGKATLLFLIEILSGIFPIIKKRFNGILRNINFFIVWITLICLNICLAFPSFTGLFNKKGEINNKKTFATNIADADVFRISKIQQGNDSDINSSLLTSEHSISTYWSILPGRLTQYYLDFELFSIYSAQELSVFGLSSPLNTLASVKYFIEESDDLNMYGVKKRSNNIYENELALPFGYVYTHTVSEEQYNSLNPVEKIESIMQGCVLKDNKGNDKELKAKTDVDKIPIVKIKMSGINQNGNFYVAEAGSTMTIYYNTIEDYEAYLYLQGISIPEKEEREEVTITLKTNDILEEAILKSKKNIYYFERNNILFPMGISNKNYIKECTLQFSSNVSFLLDSIDVLGYPISNYEDWISGLKSSVMKNVTFENNVLTGNINCKNSGYLLISIPYSDGWSAYIDNKFVNIVEANHLYMAIPIDEGYHEIRLIYSTPGKSIGLLIGAVGIFIWCFPKKLGIQKFAQLINDLFPYTQ